MLNERREDVDHEQLTRHEAMKRDSFLSGGSAFWAELKRVNYPQYWILNAAGEIVETPYTLPRLSLWLRFLRWLPGGRWTR